MGQFKSSHKTCNQEKQTAVGEKLNPYTFIKPIFVFKITFKIFSSISLSFKRKEVS